MNACRKTELYRIIYSHKYSADLMTILVNNVVVRYYYFEGHGDDGFILEDIIDYVTDTLRGILITDTLIISARRALQGSRIMEELEITGNSTIIHDRETGKSKKL